MPIYARDSNGNIKKVVQIFHNDGSGIKEIKEMYTNYNGTIGRVFSKNNPIDSNWYYFASSSYFSSTQCVQNYSEDYYEVSIASGTANCNFNLYSDFSVNSGDLIEFELTSAGAYELDEATLKVFIESDSETIMLDSVERSSDNASKTVSFKDTSSVSGNLKLLISMARNGGITTSVKISNIKINGNKVLIKNVTCNDDRNYDITWTVTHSAGAAAVSTNSAYNLGKTLKKFQSYYIDRSTASGYSFVVYLTTNDFNLLPTDNVTIWFDAVAETTSSAGDDAYNIISLNDAANDNVKLLCKSNNLFVSSYETITETNLSTTGGIQIDITTEAPGESSSTISMDSVHVIINGNQIF